MLAASQAGSRPAGAGLSRNGKDTCRQVLPQVSWSRGSLLCLLTRLFGRC